MQCYNPPQFGPSLQVSGSEAHQNGLGVSLFTRLSQLYHSYGPIAAGTYVVSLATSHNSHPGTPNLAAPPIHGPRVFGPSHFPAYPLVFVCSSVDQVALEEGSDLFSKEASVVVEVVTKCIEEWPQGWGEFDCSKACITSAWAPQV